MAQRRASWSEAVAFRFFSIALVCLALGLSMFLYFRSVTGQPDVSQPWQDRNLIYRDVGRWVEEAGNSEHPVMVNDAPAFYYFTQIPSVSIPNEGLGILIEAAHRYGVAYLVLEADHPSPLQGVYEGKESDTRLELQTTMSGPGGSAVEIWRVEQEP